MHEDLLGYLLGALEPHEMRRVARWLEEDPAARAELDQLQRALRPLEQSLEPIEPPPADLVSRTLANLPPLPIDPATQTPVSQATAAESFGTAPLVAMNPTVEPSREPANTWMDWAGGAAAAAVVLALLLPSLAQGRFEARKVACQDQLRQFGTAITHFVLRSEQERLPAVNESGPEAFAGVYAVRLQEAGLLPDAAMRWCPSLNPPVASDGRAIPLADVPAVEQLHEAAVDQLREMQQFAGGHYAYTLGVIDQDRYASPRYESRSSFAVMSDAPLSGIPISVGNGASEWAGRVGHSGEGINVLFEDGRVQFMALSSLDSMPDHPLLNHRGDVEAGVNIDDASLAPSWRPPFVSVRQR